jgi:hypothetical protein
MDVAVNVGLALRTKFVVDGVYIDFSQVSEWRLLELLN